MQVTRKISARIHQRRPDIVRLGCGVIAPAEGLLPDCAPSALLFQRDVTGLLWEKTVCCDCCNVYGMCYCLRVLTITYKNAREQTAFVDGRKIGRAGSAFSVLPVLTCFAGLLCGQMAAQDANESLGP